MQPRSKSQPHTIRTDTVILPAIIAFHVRAEIEDFLDVDLGANQDVQDYLVDRADRVYGIAHDGYFAKKIRSKANHGDAGRDFLWMFMRHWICGWIKDHMGYEVFNRIPRNYTLGGDLPERKVEPSRGGY